MSKPLATMYVKGAIPEDIERKSILNISTRNVTTQTHGFHKYPAKFIPDIPRWAIEKYLNGEKEQTILDPFCGSGTTLVEGVLAGHNVIGVDVDPLSLWISKVKTTRLDMDRLIDISDWLIKGIRSGKKGRFMPECETIRCWFSPDAIVKLSIIRSLINEIPDKFGKNRKTKDIQDFLMICFSSIIRRVSNADNESQKTYVSHTKIKKPEEVNNLFLSRLEMFTRKISDFSELVNSKLRRKYVRSSSTTSLKKFLEGEKIDLAITSPPYIKAIDYIYNQMVELFWVGDWFDMQTQKKQNSQKEKYIGDKNMGKSKFVDYRPHENSLHINKLDENLQQVFDTDQKNGHRHSYVAFKYFSDMEKHFCQIKRHMQKGSHYVMVIGDSSVSGVYFETADFLMQIAQRNGFTNVNQWGYKIKNRYMRFDRKGRGGIIKIDRVLDFEKK